MIIAQIATMPGREKTLEIACNSLKNQVNFLKVIKNAPLDGMKFAGLKDYSMDDIIFVCDDDIEYPPDFVETMVRHLSYGAVYTVMGKILKPRPIQSYYQDYEKLYQTFDDNEKLVEVEIPGTCGMVFHRSTCPDLDGTFFKSMNSDIWMAIYCKEHNIPAFVVPHKGDWLKNLMPMLPKDTFSVYNNFHDNDKEMTDLINERL